MCVPSVLLKVGQDQQKYRYKLTSESVNLVKLNLIGFGEGGGLKLGHDIFQSQTSDSVYRYTSAQCLFYQDLKSLHIGLEHQAHVNLTLNCIGKQPNLIWSFQIQFFL